MFQARAQTRRAAARLGISSDALRERRAFMRVSDDWPPPPFRDGEPASVAVRRVIKALKLPESAPAEILLQRDWSKIVGSEIARHAVPGTLSDGVLTVMVRGGAWFAELRRNARMTLLPRLRAAAGPSVRDIRIALAD